MIKSTHASEARSSQHRKGHALPPARQSEPSTEALLALYTVTNNYILQYRDLAFRTAVYTITLLGGCIGLGLNERFKALWSEQARGVLLVVLVLISAAAVAFICIINRKCLILRRRRNALDEVLGFYASINGKPLIGETTPDTFGMNWRYAIAFCLLILLVMFLALTTFSH
jgi:hypothetical protein